MNADERAIKIAKLHESSAELLADIEQRRAEREQDPIAFDDLRRAQLDAEKPMGSPPARATADPCLVYRTQDNSEPVPARTPQGMDLFGDYRDEVLFESIAGAFALDHQQRQTEVDKALAPLREQIAELRGQVSALLTLLSVKSGGDTVVELPRLPMKGRVHVA